MTSQGCGCCVGCLHLNSRGFGFAEKNKNHEILDLFLGFCDILRHSSARVHKKDDRVREREIIRLRYRQRLLSAA